MNNQIQIPLSNEAGNNKAGIMALAKGFFQNENKQRTIGLLIISAILMPIAISKYGFLPGLLVVVIVAAVPFLYSIIAYPKFGISVLMIAAYLLMWVIKMGVGFPIGTLMDGLQAFLLIGLLLKVKYKPVGDIYKNPITYWILAWILYNIFQVANPTAESKLSWVYTIRTVAMVMLMYFVFMYHISTIGFVKLVIKLWLTLSLFAAVYAVYQEYVDFLPFEKVGLYDPDMMSLLFIDGHWRKFSIFAEPVSFSYNMVASSLLCIGLMTGPLSKRKKYILGGMAFFFTYVMLFSGTRGAYVLPPVGLGMLAIVKMNKKIFIATIFGLVIFLSLIFVPTSNYTLYRFQTAFRPSNDASFNVRKANQKRIQPYILSHPLGGGLGATGAWGQRFAPASYLANFPPDSGYVRVAVELGWVGLFLFCTLMFVVLKTAINNYFSIKDPTLKSFSLAMLLIVFALSIGNYPQEAFVQFPINIYLYLVIALINIFPKLDKEKTTISK